MENLVFEPDASGVCLKRRRLDDVRFLADAVQALPGDSQSLTFREVSREAPFGLPRKCLKRQTVTTQPPCGRVL